VNPFASTESATSTAEMRDAQTARLAELVRVSGSDLGFVIDPDGELAVVVDDSGHILEPEELMLALITMIKEAVPGASVAVPVNATDAVERILGSPDAVVRTRLWGANLMETAAARSVVFAGTPDGGCAWPEFLPAYDAAVTLVKLLDLLASVDRPLSQVVAGLPSRHVVHQTIVTPWERKGTVMREIVESAGNREIELIDGVKVIEAGQWALVLPDPDEALTHVWAEAGSDMDARRVAQEYVERIRQVLR
jgi:mannose-1-phosphate guanylyltransferase/phosphomannomutase